MTNGDLFSFGLYLLDARARQLTREGSLVRLGGREFEMLRLFVSRPQQVISKNELAAAVWPDVTVDDHNIEQAVFGLRRKVKLLANQRCIENVPGRGYRFIAEVTPVKRRAPHTDLDAVLETHQAWLEGKAALETLDVDSIAQARAVFDDVVRRAPEEAWAHVGLANACALQFEMTRTSTERDTAALTLALEHAREAVSLDSKYGEAWATLGFILERVGQREKAIAAARQSIVLEPDNWRHHLRLAAASWGEERLRAARRTLTLVPGLAMAHWLAATVLVARQALDQAEEELVDPAPDPTHRFSAVGLHWLRGLIALARGDEATATAEFGLELDTDSRHLYAREVAANTWYAIGAVRFRQRDVRDAQAAFREAVSLVPAHPMANAGLGDATWAECLAPVEGAMARLVCRIATGNQADWSAEAASVASAFTSATPGNAGWLLPIEPMLNISARTRVWTDALAHVRVRAI